jgi:hypothetical protein
VSRTKGVLLLIGMTGGSRGGRERLVAAWATIVAAGSACLAGCEATIGGDAVEIPAASAGIADGSIDVSSIRPALPPTADSAVDVLQSHPDALIIADGAAAREAETGPGPARDSSSAVDSRAPAVDSRAPAVDSRAPAVDSSPPVTPEAAPPPIQTVCVPPTSGSDGFTTRFWDCCKPSCAWSTSVRACTTASNPVDDRNAQSACTGGPAHACFNFAPWAVNGQLAYGFAAHNDVACGQCFELSFTGESNSRSNDPGSTAICGKKLIVQIVNTGGIAGNQFDIMVPGGGVGDFDACSQQWGTSNLGERYGGFLLACQRQSNDYNAYKGCTKTWCSSVFSGGDKSDLLAGCNWLVDWLNVADNPKVKYRQVDCPPEIRARSGV